MSFRRICSAHKNKTKPFWVLPHTALRYGVRTNSDGRRAARDM